MCKEEPQKIGFGQQIVFCVQPVCKKKGEENGSTPQDDYECIRSRDSLFMEKRVNRSILVYVKNSKVKEPWYQCCA